MASKNMILWRTVIQAIESFFSLLFFWFCCISISHRFNYCNQRLLNIYSGVYLQVLSPLRPYQALQAFWFCVFSSFFILFFAFFFSFSCHLTKEKRSQEGQWERRIRKPENHNNYKNYKDWKPRHCLRHPNQRLT